MTRIIDGRDVDALVSEYRGKEYTPGPGGEVDRLLADPEISELASLAGRRPVPRPPRPVPFETELARSAPVRTATPEDGVLDV